MPLARLAACLGSATVAMLALAGTAWAQPPITGTDVSTFSDSFSGSLECQDEPYAITATGHTVVNFTFFEETGALYFLLSDVSALMVQQARSELLRTGDLLEEALASNPTVLVLKSRL
jgi:hypothetical protein